LTQLSVIAAIENIKDVLGSLSQQHLFSDGEDCLEAGPGVRDYGTAASGGFEEAYGG
jgi:hypothetical protein